MPQIRGEILALYRARDRRILAAYQRGVKVEQIALDEEVSASRIWQIIRAAELETTGLNGGGD